MARGYWFQLRLDPAYPEYAACSMACLDLIAATTGKVNGVLDKTEMEATAIRAARRNLYDALTRIGRAQAFDTATAEEMDSVIEAVWDGLRASMHLQSATGDVPF